ncbi:cell envelope integrity protein TolA [Pseudomonas soli]|jgi:colicin import membrane protein|uniref:Cell division and transport-associated protein TolA n=1 Tax=Pseudomonas soli TaxID=1306993 RepID=A0A1H9A864_9PSED|nr:MULTISPECIES: cell envelope integrity protein TolA [Pseudomonas]AUY33491.1 cell envelope integrity protein TolA [Pseudomonas sp. PONIH3]MCX5508687.1 cell envelope integrity protein TolA [Pseudomonas sp. BJa3]MEE1883322.1 cell envelope integrity protein TolA [Pseudomonas soli]NBK38288.1 cell envelope integrity protein TolA [Pseudomonas soli]PYC43513.1 cell envelope integrity protein TolA [Pseudomonas soli]
MQQREPSASESYFWPSVWAIALHVLVFGMLFVSFAMTPELPPSKPIVQATLYQLKSKSQATTQTNQKIAGEAKKTASRQTEVEQLEQKKVEQEAVKAAEQKKADAAQKAEEAREAAEAKKAEDAAKAAEQKKAAEAKKAEEAKKAAEKQQADIAKKKAEDEAKKKAEEEAKKQAAEEAKKKAAEDAKKKAAEDAKKKAAAEDAKKKAAEEAKKKAAADAQKKKAQEAARKAAEDKKAQALAELLSDTTERQQALADEQGDQVAGDFDDLIRMRAAEGWARPPSARKGMTVVLQINMLPDGTITNVSVAKSSGDGPFDSSAVAAVKNIGRLTEMQGLKPSDFNPYRSFKMTFTPEDLAL